MDLTLALRYRQLVMAADLEHLQLAFAYHMVCEVVGADATIDPVEFAWVRQTFPLTRLEELGLVDVDGKTTALFDDLRYQALTELPERLIPEQKLALVELVAKASAADGVLSPEEADTIAAVARILGVQQEHWMALLDDMLQSGALHRDATGEPAPRKLW